MTSVVLKKALQNGLLRSRIEWRVAGHKSRTSPICYRCNESAEGTSYFDLYYEWVEKFRRANVPEENDSAGFITAHLLGYKTVSFGNVLEQSWSALTQPREDAFYPQSSTWSFSRHLYSVITMSRSIHTKDFHPYCRHVYVSLVFSHSQSRLAPICDWSGNRRLSQDGRISAGQNAYSVCNRKLGLRRGEFEDGTSCFYTKAGDWGWWSRSDILLGYQSSELILWFKSYFYFYLSSVGHYFRASVLSYLNGACL